MDPRIQAERRARARARIVAAAQALAEHEKLPPELIERLQVRSKRPDLETMLQLEAVADLLVEVVKPYAVIDQEPAPTETEPTPETELEAEPTQPATEEVEQVPEDDEPEAEPTRRRGQQGKRAR